MNKKNLELFDLEEGATLQEITERYEVLKAKYSEERFLDGEKGNEAARMLHKIEVAYQELQTELSETIEEGIRGNAYELVDQYIKNGQLNEAQQLLDSFNERPAEWHYMQSVVFYKKSWINESKKQLEIAMHMDSSNEKYRNSYDKLMQKIEYEHKMAQQINMQQNGAQYNNANGGYNQQQQMGGNGCCDCLMACCLFQLCCRS